MIEPIASLGLPVDEIMSLRKVRLSPPDHTGKLRRVSIVTGTHGDELEGQYVCYEIARRLREKPELLTGIVDLYPALNPLGIDSITRGIPNFDLDMNRIFPGSEHGSMAEYAASQIVRDITGSDACIDVHASNIFLREIPQVRISEETADTLLPYARLLNCDFIWVHASSTVLNSTLAHALNSRGVPTLVVEMGVGMRITKAYGDQLIAGVLRLMRELGIYAGETEAVREPIVSKDGKVAFLNAPTLGMFMPSCDHWDHVQEGEKIGEIVNPLTGGCTPILAPCTGLLFTLREYPLVYEGSLLARVLRREEARA